MTSNNTTERDKRMYATLGVDNVIHAVTMICIYLGYQDYKTSLANVLMVLVNTLNDQVDGSSLELVGNASRALDVVEQYPNSVASAMDAACRVVIWMGCPALINKTGAWLIPPPRQ